MKKTTFERKLALYESFKGHRFIPEKYNISFGIILQFVKSSENIFLRGLSRFRQRSTYNEKSAF